MARELLGTELVVVDGDAERVARIVETEAYLGPADRARHASKGLTERTTTLLGPAANAYVYFIYGMHDCFNVVAGGEGERGHAVLVRAVEPIAGVHEAMRTDGPGRLTRALGITRADDGSSLLEGRIALREGTRPPRIGVSARVGVAYAGADARRLLRFFDRDSEHVSRPPRSRIGLGGAKSTGSTA